MLDSAAAILRRKLTGRSVYATDRGHLHHRLLERFKSVWGVLAFVAACCAVTSAAALLSVYTHREWVALAGCVGLVSFLLATGIFGNAEFQLLIRRLRNAGRSFAKRPGGAKDEPIETVVRLQGSGRWDTLWDTLRESAEKLPLEKISLDLSLPMIHEGYSATWARSAQVEDDRCWRVDVPLMFDHQKVGQLTVAGEQNGETTSQMIAKVLDLVEPFELKLRAIAAEQHPSPPHTGPTGGEPSFASAAEGHGNGQQGGRL